MSKLISSARILLLVLVPCFLLAPAPLWLFGPAIVDDAYITFRYADNLAAGKGFVFNQEDGPILGTSTPSFTLLLAMTRRAGIPCPAAALVFSTIGSFLVYLFGVLLFQAANARKSNAEKKPHLAAWLAPGLAWALILASLPQWVIVQISGMETMLFMGLALGALWATATGRPILAGIFAGLAVLTRYDGWALALVVVAGNAWAAREKTKHPGEHPASRVKGQLLAVAALLALQLPWILYALIQFGNYAPHSVMTKRLIHEISFTKGLLVHARYFWGTLEAMPGIVAHRPLVLLFLAGTLLLAVRRSRGLLFLLWGALSCIGFSLSGIQLFKWYFMPALAAYSWVAVWGLWTLCGWVADKALSLRTQNGGASLRWIMRWGAPGLACLILAGMQSQYVLFDRHAWPRQIASTEEAYLTVARHIKDRGAPGEKVLAGETGAIAWALPEFQVLDSSGINSRRVFEARWADRLRLRQESPDFPHEDGSPEWVWDLLLERPEWIVSLRRFLFLSVMAEDPVFQREYRLERTVQNPPAQTVYIYRRK